MPFTAQDLIADKPKPVTVQPSNSVRDALRIMVEYDFSQLPVVNASGNVLGLVTADLILQSLEEYEDELASLKINDVTAKVRTYHLMDDVFELLEGLRDNSVALIINNNRELVGIITSYDATDYFRQRAEDSMLVEDIELALRDHIEAAFTDRETGNLDSSSLQTVIDAATNRKGLAFDKLTLGQYIRVLTHEITWASYGSSLNTNKAMFEKRLKRVLDIRNGLAHFRSEISRMDRDHLRFMANWFERNPATVIMNATRLEPSAELYPSTPIVQDISPEESRYARLALHLQAQSPQQDRLRLTFDEVETIIGEDLPASARKHRSWWGNDTSHVQSQQWLGVDWRVGAINMTEGAVTFVRAKEREKLYIDFFSSLLDTLRSKATFPIRNIFPVGANWHTLGGFKTDNGIQVSALSFSFARSRRFRVELYIDSANAEWNKQIFDCLYAEKEVIESQLGEVSWERLEERRASRIAVYAKASITDSAEELQQLKNWAADTMLTMYAVLNPIMTGNGYIFRG